MASNLTGTVPDVEAAIAQLLHALRQSAQSIVSRPRPFGRQSDAVVGHRGDDSLGIASHGYVHSRGLCVPQRVDQTLLYHSVNRERDTGPEFNGQFLAKLEGDRRVAPLPVANQTLKRRGKSESIERQRGEPWNQTVHRIVQARRLV